MSMEQSIIPTYMPPEMAFNAPLREGRCLFDVRQRKQFDTSHVVFSHPLCDHTQLNENTASEG